MKPFDVLQKCLDLTQDPTEKKGRTKRLTDLLKQPEDDEETGEWFMCVPSCFNNAMDIRQTTLEGELQWTQGSTFSFKTGDTLYDTPKAYFHWEEAVRHLKIAIQVQAATDAIPEKRSKEKGVLAPRNPGAVRIIILLPNPDRTSLVPLGQFQLTQDEFVRFLIAGPEGHLKTQIERKQT